MGIENPRDGGSRAGESLEELARLADTADIEIAGRTIQVRSSIDKRTYIGSGKVLEVAEQARRVDANLIVFDDSLSPAQGRNLQKQLGMRVLDRSELILGIFALRARTSVAKIQVELAQLQYELPRLARLWEHLSRLGGGIGTRGPGETQLEVDRRRVRDRIRALTARLKKVEEDTKIQRRGRKGTVTACIVGYTNTGKSSLFNRLTSAGVLEEDRLFATLDSTSRVLQLPDTRAMILSDTIGFIRKIPHQLIASFHATLEEAIDADLLLHVVDVSNPDAERDIEVVDRVLEDIGARPEEQIMVLNKIDLAEDLRLVGRLKGEGQDAVVTSALTGEGLNDLRERLRRFVKSREIEGEVRFPIWNEEIRAFLHREGEVSEERFGHKWTRVKVRMKPECFERLRKKGVEVSIDATG